METFENWKDVPKDTLEQINSALCCADFRPASSSPTKGQLWSFSAVLNCWEYDRFLTVHQWARIAKLCAYNNAPSVKETLKGLAFEVKWVKVKEVMYKIPANVVGRIGSTYFLIEPDGRAHS